MMRAGVLAAAAAAVLGVAIAPAAGAQGEAAVSAIDPARIEATVSALVAKHGAAVRDRAARGVKQAALYWRATDGTPEAFGTFCAEHFVADPAALLALLDRFDKNLESLGGHQVALTRTLREEMELDLVAPMGVDILFASLNPFDHATEDLFRTKVAFVALLNFPLRDGDEMQKVAPKLDRRGWAEARLAQGFAMRVPGEVRAEATRIYTEANDYIDNYNVFLGHVVTADGRRLFPAGLKLISHWGLRDHIKGLYSDPRGNLEAQRLVMTVMERILRQEIPAVVVNSDAADWDPVNNRVSLPAGATGPAPSGDREPDHRYEHLLSLFKAERAIDPWSPAFPTLIARKFGFEREIPEETVKALLTAVLEDPVAREIAARVRARLGRPLEPFDIWYDGFKVRGSIPEEQRDAAVRAKYPELAAFQKDVPNLLQKLGFTADTAAFLAAHIQVDPARGAGHALGAAMRGDDAHLRTRVPKGGMDYKGYNIALHELGHTVEQTFSLYRVDRPLMMGVPNTAFTEAFAFVFQDRDLDVLGLGHDTPETRALQAIDAYWMTFEIAGVGLLDIGVWHWMYDHPDATPAQLREAVVSKAVEIWNRWYAPVLGVKDSPILAIYSHMICIAMYLPDYPIGHLIQAAYEQQFQGRSLGAEMERMTVQGRMTPDAWMRGAVGGPLSAGPLIQRAKAGLKLVK